MKIKLGCLLIIFILNITLGYFCTDYVFEFYGSKIKHEQVEVPFIASFISAMFVGQFTIPLAVITWAIVSRVWN